MDISRISASARREVGLKTSMCSLVLVCAFLTYVALPSSISAAASDAGALVDLEKESEIIANARQSVRGNDDAGSQAQLDRAEGLARGGVNGAILARRAAGVCGWLRSDGDYGRARKVASRTLQRLARSTESNDGDRVERLFWEAFLEGEILEHRYRALALLQEAEKLAPDDDRILQAQEKWASIIAAFGESRSSEVAP